MEAISANGPTDTNDAEWKENVAYESQTFMSYLRKNSCVHSGVHSDVHSGVHTKRKRCRVHIKKVFHKNEEEMQEKMKMT